MKKLTLENLKQIVKEELVCLKGLKEQATGGSKIWEVWELPRSPGNDPVGYVVANTEQEAMDEAKRRIGNLLMKVIPVSPSTVRKRMRELEAEQARVNKQIQECYGALQQYIPTMYSRG